VEGQNANIISVVVMVSYSTTSMHEIPFCNRQPEGKHELFVRTKIEGGGCCGFPESFSIIKTGLSLKKKYPALIS
jgi:hypothetical protein